MFLFKKSYLGVGMVMGMAAGAAMVAGMVMACPEGRCMARRAVRRGKRMVHHYMPMMEKHL